MRADRGAGDVPDILPDLQRIGRRLAAELPAPRFVSHLAPARLAVDQDVHVAQRVGGVGRHEIGDRPVLALRVDHLGEAEQGAVAGDAIDFGRVQADGVYAGAGPIDALDRRRELLRRGGLRGTRRDHRAEQEQARRERAEDETDTPPPGQAARPAPRRRDCAGAGNRP